MAAAPVEVADFKSPGLGVMKWVPPGTFVMGSPLTEKGRSGDERPHSVTLTRGFWMMEGEVTCAQWLAVMGEDPERPITDPLEPISRVSWDEAQAFAAKLSEREGQLYRLPTEAEWERAARGGQNHRFSGSDVAEEVGWVNSNASGRLHPPCGLARNAYGLCDMTGNVWEWVADWYGRYPVSATDPTGPATGTFRVIRGAGNWVADPNRRVARRDETLPSARLPSIGFRLVRVESADGRREPSR